MNYYTYIYYDPSRNNEPFYVGKGHNERAWSHLKSKHGGPFMNRLRKMIRNGIRPIIGLYSGLEEEFAHLLEQELISKFGRKNLGKGPLLNLTDGGEGSSGLKMSDETKKKMSESRKGRISPMKGKRHSEEAKKKIGRSGEDNAFYGKKHTEETKQQHSELMKGRFAGDKNHFYGKTHDSEIIEKVRQQNIGRKHSEEAKSKISEASKNRIRRPFTDEEKKRMSESAKLRWKKDK